MQETQITKLDKVCIYTYKVCAFIVKLVLFSSFVRFVIALAQGKF